MKKISRWVWVSEICMNNRSRRFRLKKNQKSSKNVNILKKGSKIYMPTAGFFLQKCSDKVEGGGVPKTYFNPPPMT